MTKVCGGRIRLSRLLGAVYCFVALGGVTAAFGTPIFARQTKLPCSACHSQVPRLNEFGQRFFANGYKLPGRKLAVTLPIWFQAAICPSGDTTVGRPTHGNKIDVGWDDNIVGSLGYFPGTNTLFHVVYAPFVREERIDVTQPLGRHFSIEGGTFAMTSQTDPRLDLNNFQPATLSPHGSSFGRFSPFAPDGVALALRVVGATGSSLPYADGSKVAVTLPLSNEIAGGGYNGVHVPSKFSNRPTGAFVELYNRKGMNSIGASGFFGRDGRHYYGFWGQRRFGKFFVQGGAAYDQWPFGITRLATLGVDFRQSYQQVYGLRIDQQDKKTSLVPTMNFSLDGRDNAPSINIQEVLEQKTKPQTLVTIFWRF